MSLTSSPKLFNRILRYCTLFSISKDGQIRNEKFEIQYQSALYSTFNIQYQSGGYLMIRCENYFFRKFEYQSSGYSISNINMVDIENSN